MFLSAQKEQAACFSTWPAFLLDSDGNLVISNLIKHNYEMLCVIIDFIDKFSFEGEGFNFSYKIEYYLNFFFWGKLRA